MKSKNKCSKCGEDIEKNREAWINKKMVCQKCYVEIKLDKKGYRPTWLDKWFKIHKEGK